MKKFIYTACFYPEDNGQYSVIFPDFSGATYGNNLEDAYNMAVDYLGGVIITTLDDGEELPKATEIKEIKANEYPNGFTTLISVDADEYRLSKSVRRTISLPDWLDRLATDQKISLSKELQNALKQRFSIN